MRQHSMFPSVGIRSFFLNYFLCRSLDYGAIGTNLPNFGHVLKIHLKRPICCGMSIYPALGQQLQNSRTNFDENHYGRNPLNFVEPLKLVSLTWSIILPNNENSLVSLSTDFSRTFTPASLIYSHINFAKCKFLSFRCILLWMLLYVNYIFWLLILLSYTT